MKENKTVAKSKHLEGISYVQLQASKQLGEAGQ